jgi:hypothetical protein
MQLIKFVFASILKMIYFKKFKYNNVHIHICAWLMHVLIIDTLDKMLIQNKKSYFKMMLIKIIY